MKQFGTLLYDSFLKNYQFSKNEWPKLNDSSFLARNTDRLLKEKIIVKKAVPSIIEYFMTYIVNQFRSAQFLKQIDIVRLALLCAITACSAKYLNFIICLALLLSVTYNVSQWCQTYWKVEFL